MEIPRGVSQYQEDSKSIKLHAFADASKQGISVVIYESFDQETGHTQRLLVAKSRLAKQGLSISRLEVVAGHLAATMLELMRRALSSLAVLESYAWLDSLIAFYWNKGKGRYKEFVKNRVKLIQEKSVITWKHVPTEENPADIGSRGCRKSRIPSCLCTGPNWLYDKDAWPLEVEVKPDDETEKEAKPIRDLFRTVHIEKDRIDRLINTFCFWKAMRILAWKRGSTDICSSMKKNRISGQFTTEEIQNEKKLTIIREQERIESTERFMNDKESKGTLHLQGKN